MLDEENFLKSFHVKIDQVCHTILLLSMLVITLSGRCYSNMKRKIILLYFSTIKKSVLLLI